MGRVEVAMGRVEVAILLSNGCLLGTVEGFISIFQTQIFIIRTTFSGGSLVLESL